MVLIFGCYSNASEAANRVQSSDCEQSKIVSHLVIRFAFIVLKASIDATTPVLHVSQSAGTKVSQRLQLSCFTCKFSPDLPELTKQF